MIRGSMELKELDSLVNYKKSRDEIVNSAWEKRQDLRDKKLITADDSRKFKESIQNFVFETSKWLDGIKKVRNDFIVSSEQNHIDEILNSLLGYATNTNHNSLNNIKGKLEKSSAEEIKALMQEHVKEVGTQMENSFSHVQKVKLSDPGYGVATYKR